MMNAPAIDLEPRAIHRHKRRAEAALDWLARSQDATCSGGSAASYTPLWGWSHAYPETTGYLVPTLWRGADTFRNPDLATRAERAARWLLTQQQAEGWFPAGAPGRRSALKPSAFNSAQVLTGLTEAFRRTQDDCFLAAARRTAAWLVATQDADGRWSRDCYTPGYATSYDAHLCGPLAEFARMAADGNAEAAARRGLDAVLSDRRPDGSFARWSFSPGRPAFTHTIGYTLAGLLQAARLLDAWEPYGEAAAATAGILLSKAEVRHQLAGAYGAGWRPITWYRCLTGHCQIAAVWIELYHRTGDARLLNAAAKRITEVGDTQHLRHPGAGLRGAIAGSAPLIGSYMRLRYPNWAAKFFVDAALDLDACLTALWPPETSRAT